MLHLFTVADRFQIEGRGCVLVPGLPCEPGDPNVKRGARIRLRTPTGRAIDTFVKEIEMISYRKRPEKIATPVLLPRDITKDDVPAGTDVLLLEETYETIKRREPNKSLQPTPGSGYSSAARFTSLGPAWLSSDR